MKLGTGAVGLTTLGLAGHLGLNEAEARPPRSRVVNLRIQRLEQQDMSGTNNLVRVRVCFVYNVPPPPPPPTWPFARVISLNSAPMPNQQPLPLAVNLTDPNIPQDPRQQTEIQVRGAEVFVWFTFYAWRCDFVIIIVDNRRVRFHVG
ncbi:MAG: hypothetical protein AB7I30_00230 [Isosphaeraceae bacterium]